MRGEKGLGFRVHDILLESNMEPPKKGPIKTTVPPKGDSGFPSYFGEVYLQRRHKKRTCSHRIKMMSAEEQGKPLYILPSQAWVLGGSWD